MNNEIKPVVVRVDENAPKYWSQAVTEEIDVYVGPDDLAGALVETIDGTTHMFGHFQGVEEANNRDYWSAISGLGKYALEAGLPELSVRTRNVRQLNILKNAFGENSLTYDGVDPNGPFKDSPLELPITSKQVSLSLQRMAHADRNPFTQLDSDNDFFTTRVNLGQVNPSKFVQPIVKRLPLESED